MTKYPIASPIVALIISDIAIHPHRIVIGFLLPNTVYKLGVDELPGPAVVPLRQTAVMDVLTIIEKSDLLRVTMAVIHVVK